MNTAHFDPFDGDGSPEEEPNCPKCGGELDWIDCTWCDGDGMIPDDEDEFYTGGLADDYIKCLACGGEGGWYHCEPCREAFALEHLEWEHERQLNQREVQP